MGRLRKFLDHVEPMFSRGGRFEKFGALYEMLDTFLYTPPDVTPSAPHVRDAIDLKRVMTYVVIAVTPCALFGMYNIGLQANLAMAEMGIAGVEGWRGSVLAAMGIGYDPESIGACFWHGFLYFLPVYIVTLAAGGFWEVLFAIARNHEVNEGFLVTSMLYTLILPPTIPLWQVALGISFAVVIGKEVFGGTGKNFLNPALTGRAFLYFAYPAQNSGNDVWVTVDGFTGASPLAAAQEGGLEAIEAAGYTLTDLWMGLLPGTIGAESALACVIGAAFLLYTRIASWRIMLGVLVGLVATVLLFNGLAGPDSNPYLHLSPHWHIVAGGFAFGLVFMATDPVSASMTAKGKFIFGALIGVLTALIRVINPAFPEGIMLAILLANVFAPLIDYFVVQANVRRRQRKYV
ncbi:MAG TPA: NADH:ubiquinone reductase (Na(+)-transporting) subunit B [Gammaproteobacteria bacterium]|nr:NADH:ubiquinone reductase (Na(+)-transporting) subunit B [Gammaproteobacteria bacterium]